MKKTAFTMIELIFVIVILGILSAIALPKFSSVKESTDISRLKSDVASIRSAIMNERQGRIIKGDSSYLLKLTDSNSTLFDLVLKPYGIKAGTSSGEWSKVDDTTYKCKVGDKENTFTYSTTDGSFKCTSGDYCDKLNN